MTVKSPLLTGGSTETTQLLLEVVISDHTVTVMYSHCAIVGDCWNKSFAVYWYHFHASVQCGEWTKIVHILAYKM